MSATSTNYALIKGSTIVQISSVTFPVHHDFNWVEVPAGLSPDPYRWTYENGQFVAPPPPPPPTLEQQAAAALGAGLTITLTGSMSFGPAVFPTDEKTQRRITSVVTAINATGGFPGGATTFPMLTSQGWVNLTPSQYKGVAAAIASYVSALDLIIAGNPLGVTQLPPNSITLSV